MKCILDLDVRTFLTPKYEKEYFKNAGQDWNYLSLSTRQGYEGTLPGLFISY